jgi:predicted ATPase with chaperone activity
VVGKSNTRESKDRVKAAIQNSGYPFPFERITVNLAPASLKKEGAGFDLPIAVGILAALGIMNAEKAAGNISVCSLFTHHCSLLLGAGAREAGNGGRCSRIA